MSLRQETDPVTVLSPETKLPIMGMELLGTSHRFFGVISALEPDWPWRCTILQTNSASQSWKDLRDYQAQALCFRSEKCKPREGT